MSTYSRFVLGETPVNPDSSLLKDSKTYNSAPLSKGCTSIWTVMHFICGSGDIVASKSLQRCLSVPVDVAKLTSANEVCVAATDNKQQSEECWVNLGQVWLPRSNTYFINPGLVLIYGNSSKVTRELIELTVRHALYVIEEPSHTSISLQVTDVGLNRFLKTQ